MERFYPNFYSYTKSHYEPLTAQSLCRSESVATGLSQRPVQPVAVNDDDDAQPGRSRLGCSSTDHMHRVGVHVSGLCEPFVTRKRMLSGECHNSGNFSGHSDIRADGRFTNADSSASCVNLHAERWMREQSDPPGPSGSSAVDNLAIPSSLNPTELVTWSSSSQSEKLRSTGTGKSNMLVIPRSVPLYPTRADCALGRRPVMDDQNVSVDKTRQPMRQVSFRQDKHCSSPISSNCSTLKPTKQDPPGRPLAQVRPQGQFNVEETKEDPRVQSCVSGKLMKSGLLKPKGNEKSRRFGLKLEKPVRKNQSGKSTRSPSPCVTNKLPAAQRVCEKEIACGTRHAPLGIPAATGHMKRLIETERAVREELASGKMRGISPISPSVLDSIVPTNLTPRNSPAPSSTSCSGPCCKLNLVTNPKETPQISASCAFVRPRRRHDHDVGCSNSLHRTHTCTTSSTKTNPSALTSNSTPCAIVHPLRVPASAIGYQSVGGPGCTRPSNSIPMQKSSSSSDFGDLKPCPILTVSLCETLTPCGKVRKSEDRVSVNQRPLRSVQ
ncbi:unnamed protein product [Echinostoma caproni]|uniref:Uncharacterized protein n=1 Tax=Echinostoma caproni TaxID=27848 RepID=A0A183AX91_9TREM|nr:unnamed protein product [Echinostoma caproni]